MVKIYDPQRGRYQMSMSMFQFFQQAREADRWAIAQIETMVKEGYVEKFPGHWEKHDDKGHLVSIVSL